MGKFTPTKEDKFSFGLWTVGNPGRDPFGDPVRDPIPPTQIVARLARCGAYGVNLHDNDLIPMGASKRQRQDILGEFREALVHWDMVVPMATTNLFSHPVFKDGAFTANDAGVRGYALQKTMAGIDLGAELGAEIYVFWGGREGTEADACRDPRVALQRYRYALDFLCEYVREKGYEMRFALEAKPNEPRGDNYLPTTGHMLHFITTLKHPEMVGVNPEVAHETMSGLSFVHGVAQAMDADKLFHIDLNAQKIGRYDQDLRFGSEDPKQALLLVRLLEGTMGGERYEGPRHFDAHAYRTESEDGVWDFATGCMRTYKMLVAKAEAFDANPEVRDLIGEVGSAEHACLLADYTTEAATNLRETAFDLEPLARRGLGHERLDQLLIEYLFGLHS